MFALLFLRFGSLCFNAILMFMEILSNIIDISARM